MNFDPVRPYLPLIKALVVVAAVLAFAWAWHAHNAAQQKIGYDKAVGVYQVALDKAKDEARTQETEWRKKWEGAVNDAAETEKRLVVARAAAAAADERLRRTADDFRQRLPGASAEACRAAAATAAGLLETCAGRYRAVAEAAAGHAADVRKLEAAWPE